MTQKASEPPVAVVSAILEKMENGIRKVFIQTRWKPKTSPTYSGMLEIPAGCIESYENVFDAIKREVQEECGLEITSFRNAYQGETLEPGPLDRSMVFQPFVCQQVLSTNDGRPWIGFVFLCEVKGEPRMQESEAKDPRWVSIEELEKILDEGPETVFPLQYPVLKYYVARMKGMEPE